MVWNTSVQAASWSFSLTANVRDFLYSLKRNRVEGTHRVERINAHAETESTITKFLILASLEQFLSRGVFVVTFFNDQLNDTVLPGSSGGGILIVIRLSS